MSKLAQSKGHLTCIQDVFGSNIGRYTAVVIQNCRRFPQIVSRLSPNPSGSLFTKESNLLY